jgi:hypothetical protein
MKYFYKFFFVVYNYYILKTSYGERGVIMRTWFISKLKYNVMIRTHLLNLLLLFFSPRNKFIIALSQNLDKYIVLYQEELLSLHHKQHNSKAVDEIAA